ncbi:glutathione S-transferase N-terminal domain-containing protein [Gammaproteobacteria bacterium AH-315-C21]|nr:glutathione S-transferase N-terminal domain-containing protein [Gammaproteobacteria bacterium AH-315-C21]
MTLALSKRPGMTLFCYALCSRCHRTRLAVAEKNIAIDIVDVEDGDYPEDLLELNPYQMMPTLVDRELALYDSRLIVEYIDERFPHPPLMPIDPVARAKTRLMLYRIERDWYCAADAIERGSKAEGEEARRSIRDGLAVLAPMFSQAPYFMSSEFTMIDCYLAPLLWRLQHYDIKLPKTAQPVLSYAERLFARATFQSSLSAQERELR